MAAYAALLSLMQTIHDIQRHPSPPISLHTQQVESLTHTVGFLQEFLESYVSPDADGDEADPLEMRIADAAYAVQDIIESHIVHKISKALEETQIRKKFLINHNFYENIRQVMEKMDLIKKELMEAASVFHDQRHSFISASSSRPSSSSDGQNNVTVFSEDVLFEIMDNLIGGRLDLQIIPIVGMGGIGKTTLAKTVYSYEVIKKHFDICVWATISQQYNLRDLLCDLLSQTNKKKEEELSKMSQDELGEEFYKYLFGRRFLVVMDDMWNIDLWVRIQHFFPKNEECSRVLVTTRLSQLSSQLNNKYSLQMKFLDEVSSWGLFTKTVFGEECCPPDLVEIGKKIAGNCRGLPLSIVVVGGLLKKMEYNEGSWESTRKSLTSMVNLDNDKHCLRLLKLSYNHLPVYLKPCFLYMGVFEEDKRIRVSTIVKLWISEGFVKAKEGKSLEATGKELLKDLIDRNLIITHSLGLTGNIKLCKIHDLLRDLCLNQGKKEGFFHVVGQHYPRGINSQRRAIIPRNSSEKKVCDALGSMPYARSIICEYGDVSRCQNYCGLRKTIHVLDDYFKTVYLDSLVFRINLRHLVGQVRRKSSLFSSMGLLWNMQTLIISCADLDESVMPIQFWKFSHIRRIEFVGYYVSLPDPLVGDGVILENLQTLKGVRNLEVGEEVVKRIPNIKKLDIMYDGVNKGSKLDDPYCFSSIECLSKLESLTIHCYGYVGEFVFPHSLKRLNLEVLRRKFEWKLDVLEKIGSLPLLEMLELSFGWLEEGKWEIEEGQFPSLKYLSLVELSGLEQLAAEEGSSIIFPCLQHLRLVRLKELKEMRSEIGNIPTLRKVDLIYCNELLVKCMKEIVEEQVEFQDPLPFHVLVKINPKHKHLQSLADPNFEVSW